MNRLESATTYVKNRLTSSEVLADELFFHWLGYSDHKKILQAISNGIPLFGLRERGTISKCYLLGHSGNYLLIHIPKKLQLQVVRRARYSDFENDGSWGFSFTTIVPQQYQILAEEWYKRMKQENAYYKDFPEMIKPSDFRCLPASYIVGHIDILAKYETYLSSYGNRVTTYYKFPGRVSIVPRLPNKGFSSVQILNALNYYSNFGGRENGIHEF